MSTEKNKRKELLRALKEKQLEEFINSLPVDKLIFYKLFYYVDGELSEHGCDHTLHKTEQFLFEEGIADILPVINWIKENGGFCDCEVLANVQDKFA